MRESALFGTMFGLGAGAVLVGVTVSRLVVGQVPEKSAAEPATVGAQTPPAIVSPPAEPPAQTAVQRQGRGLSRKHRRPPVEEESTAATASIPGVSAANVEAEAVPPSPVDAGDSPIAIVRGGTVRPILGSPGPGARVIQVDPSDGEH